MMAVQKKIDTGSASASPLTKEGLERTLSMQLGVWLVIVMKLFLEWPQEVFQIYKVL